MLHLRLAGLVHPDRAIPGEVSIIGLIEQHVANVPFEADEQIARLSVGLPDLEPARRLHVQSLCRGARSQFFPGFLRVRQLPRLRDQTGAIGTVPRRRALTPRLRPANVGGPQRTAGDLEDLGTSERRGSGIRSRARWDASLA